jgi:hypothetical protein
MTYADAIERLFECRRERDDAEATVKGLRLEVARLREERDALRAELARRPPAVEEGDALERMNAEGDACPL